MRVFRILDLLEFHDPLCTELQIKHPADCYCDFEGRHPLEELTLLQISDSLLRYELLLPQFAKIAFSPEGYVKYRKLADRALIGYRKKCAKLERQVNFSYYTVSLDRAFWAVAKSEMV